MTLPHQNEHLALYYALRWIAKRAGCGSIAEEELSLAEVNITRSGKAWYVYAWEDYLIVFNQAERNLIVLHNSGTTKTFRWK